MGEHVMMPVPEEIVPEIRTYLAHNVDRRVFMLDPNDAVVAYYRDAPPEAQSLLHAVAHSTVNMDEITYEATCRELDMAPRELMGLVYEINYYTVASGGPTALYAKPHPGDRPDHVEEWAHRIWVMDPKVARSIVAAGTSAPGAGTRQG